jgi:hypothetical protein
VDQAFDSPETGTCAKRTLGGLARTGVLLMGAVLVCILSVDLPIPAGRAADGQGPAQAYVPASGRWIELGPSADREASRQPDPLTAQVLQPRGGGRASVAPARREAQKRHGRRLTGSRFAAGEERGWHLTPRRPRAP